MTRPIDPTGAARSRPSDDERLDSWKEIAAFLHRDVRTVQRWEKQAGLPVHRHAESRLRTAYAYRSELEAWWGSQRNPETGSADPTRARFGHLPWKTIGIVAAGFVFVASTTGVLLWIRTPPETAPASTRPKITVLVARLDNQAGDPSLGAIVEHAIGHQILTAPGIDTATPARVTRMLRLMRRDPGTQLTPPVGREISIRDGGVSFVIASRLLRVQSRYFVELQALEPTDGRVYASIESDATDAAAIPNRGAQAAERLAHDLANGAAPRGPLETLEPVTTTSLAAVRLYTSAVQAGARRQWGASELLARQAIAADPQFASAQAWTAWAMRRQGRTVSECLPLVDRAVQLGASASDREIYLIGGTRHSIAGDLTAAIAAYEALLRLQPRDRQALDRLAEAYARAGRLREAVEVLVKRGESEPADFYANVRAAHALVVWQGNRRRADPFLVRAQQLQTAATAIDWPRWTAWLTALPVFDAWIAGNNRAAFDALASLEHGLDGRLGRDRDAFGSTIGFSYVAFGKLRQARRAFQHVAAPVRQLDLAMLALASGDERSARDWLLQITRSSAQRPALFARVGLTAEAERGLEGMLPSDHAEGIAEVTRGLIATRKGDDEAALTSLRRGVELLRFSGEPEYFLGVEALARIWLTRGEFERAADWLGDASEQRGRTYGAAQWTAGAWIGVNADLFRICRQHGRRDEAQQLGVLLARTLKDADEQHVVARAVRASVQ